MIKVSGVEEEAAWLLHRAAEYLQSRGEPAPARLLFERARDLRRRILGDDHPNTLESAGSLSLNLWELGQFEPARQLVEDTVIRGRRILGDDHPLTLRLTESLAITLRESGYSEQARQLGEDTLTRMRRVLGDDHPHTLRAARNFDAISQIVQEGPMRGHARGPIEEMTD
jgi:Tetratricopeptide repeat